MSRVTKNNKRQREPSPDGRLTLANQSNRQNCNFCSSDRPVTFTSVRVPYPASTPKYRMAIIKMSPVRYRTLMQCTARCGCGLSARVTQEYSPCNRLIICTLARLNRLHLPVLAAEPIVEPVVEPDVEYGGVLDDLVAAQALPEDDDEALEADEDEALEADEDVDEEILRLMAHIDQNVIESP